MPALALSALSLSLQTCLLLACVVELTRRLNTKLLVTRLDPLGVCYGYKEVTSSAV